MPRLRGACPNCIPCLRGVRCVPTILFIMLVYAHLKHYFDLTLTMIWLLQLISV
jgi:hypothetical protein